MKIKTRPNAGPGRPTPEESAARREQFIYIGSRVICERGYHGSSIRDIVNAVGVPTGSFYNYFRGKEAFVIEALQFHMEKRFVEFSLSMDKGAESPRQRIVDSFKNNPDHIASDVFTPMTFLTKLQSEVGSDIEGIRQIGTKTFDRFRDALAGCILTAQEAGEINKDKDATDTATYLIVSWWAVLLHTYARENSHVRELFLEVLERDILS
jgi:TetR/AcrR family transcriptional repressor of nem operon